MGGVSTRETGQVCYVTLPPAKQSSPPCTALALVPFIQHYFPMPESIKELHDLYCSDRVKATFASSSPRQPLESYYQTIVVAAETTRQVTTAATPPKSVPIATMVLSRNYNGEWSVMGYLSYRTYNIRGETGARGIAGMFKHYTGSQPAGETDIAIAAIRAGMVQFSHLTGGDGALWPQELQFTFNEDNSGTAGLMNRLFKYIALRQPTQQLAWNCTHDPVKRQYTAESTDTESLRAMCQALCTDTSTSCVSLESLRSVDDGRLWDNIWSRAGKPESWTDEPCLHANVKARTNDANFNPAASLFAGNQSVMGLHLRLKEIHDECKARSHKEVCIQHADAAVGEQLFKAFGLKKASASQLNKSLPKLSFLTLITIPSDQLHAPEAAQRALLTPLAVAYAQQPCFADLFESDERHAKAEVLQRCAVQEPWLVIIMLCEWRGRPESWRYLYETIVRVVSNQFPSSQPIVDDGLVVNRMLDLRQRGLTSLTFADVVALMEVARQPRLALDEDTRANYAAAETVATVLQFSAMDG